MRHRSLYVSLSVFVLATLAGCPGVDARGQILTSAQRNDVNVVLDAADQEKLTAEARSQGR